MQCNLLSALREAAEKKFPPLMAGPLRDGGGLKAGPLRKKELFLKVFFILLPFKNKNYFSYRNMEISH